MSEERALAVRPELNPLVLKMFHDLDAAAFKSRRFGVTEGETVIKLLFCYENGLALSVANTGLYVVNGKMQVEGHVVAAQFRRHPQYDYTIEDHDEEGCTIVVWHDGAEIGEARFDKTHATRAGLINKDAFKKYPHDLYFNKAIARAFRRFAPDLFTQSVYIPGELPGSDDSVATTWEVVDAEKPEEPRSQEMVKAVTLDDLVAKHGADAVLAANEGLVPGTEDEVYAAAERLGA